MAGERAGRGAPMYISTKPQPLWDKVSAQAGMGTPGTTEKASQV